MPFILLNGGSADDVSGFSGSSEENRVFWINPGGGLPRCDGPGFVGSPDGGFVDDGDFGSSPNGGGGGILNPSLSRMRAASAGMGGGRSENDISSNWKVNQTQTAAYVLE